MIINEDELIEDCIEQMQMYSDVSDSKARAFFTHAKMEKILSNMWEAQEQTIEYMVSQKKDKHVNTTRI